jgi:uncharacterized membrane protein YsdA (DUF1294 family)
MLARVCLYLATINLVAFAVYGLDKRAAVRGGWRVRESTLLLLAFAGGSVGAVAAQQLLRHKTRKEPFRTVLFTICAFQPAEILAIWLYLAAR